MAADKRADKLSTHAAKKSDAKGRRALGGAEGIERIWGGMGSKFMGVARRRCKTFALNLSGANNFSILLASFFCE